MSRYDDDPGHDIDDKIWIQGCAALIGVVLLVLITNSAPEWLIWVTLVVGFAVVGVLLRRRMRSR